MHVRQEGRGRDGWAGLAGLAWDGGRKLRPKKHLYHLTTANRLSLLHVHEGKV